MAARKQLRTTTGVELTPDIRLVKNSLPWITHPQSWVGFEQLENKNGVGCSFVLIKPQGPLAKQLWKHCRKAFRYGLSDGKLQRLTETLTLAEGLLLDPSLQEAQELQQGNHDLDHGVVAIAFPSKSTHSWGATPSKSTWSKPMTAKSSLLSRKRFLW